MCNKVVAGLAVWGMITALSLTAQARTGAEATEAPQWKVRAELSYTSSSGNTDSETLAGKLALKREEIRNRYYFNGSVFRTENDNDETANKWGTEGRYERVIHERLFGFGDAYYIRDKFSGYRYRYGFGPGVGYDIVSTDAQSLKSRISLIYSYDRYSEGTEKSNDYLAGKVDINYEWHIMEHLIFREDAYYHVSFDDSDVYFLNSETALEVKINDAVSLGLSYIIAYQNKPPSPEIDDTDRIFLTSLIIDF